MFTSFKNMLMAHNCISPCGTLQVLKWENITLHTSEGPFLLKRKFDAHVFSKKDFSRKYSILRWAKYSFLLSLYTSLMSAV